VKFLRWFAFDWAWVRADLQRSLVIADQGTSDQDQDNRRPLVLTNPTFDHSPPNARTQTLLQILWMMRLFLQKLLRGCVLEALRTTIAASSYIRRDLRVYTKTAPVVVNISRVRVGYVNALMLKWRDKLLKKKYGRNSTSP
jgi:hypothetical protein